MSDEFIEHLNILWNISYLSAFVILVLSLLSLIWLLKKVYYWAREMPKTAYILLAIFPLISIFPISPPQFKNVEKAKEQQIKRKEDNGDPELDD
ncbi:hypothetical protein [Shewanella sp. 10N.286.48.B5]|uniref:hypothetical protein n=1 Tax=Shewanella sp. 10N.286.48.B5 TaxID=1880834 RepID=UPI000C825097|nr:hypothetical protein [Shewanella sp. 10N.286.48.B5]PMH86813.1 hypothetical protein BCU57_09510 [Shewanella sp. 10N.286.48.B5]